MSIKIPVLTARQMRQVDRLMIDELGIGLVQMMQNAGRNLAEMAQRLSGGSVIDKSIVILCGTGNNGGAGMVAGRHLHNWGPGCGLCWLERSLASRKSLRFNGRLLSDSD